MTNHRILSESNNLRPLHIVAGAIAMVLVIGTIDYITGSQVSIAPLYLVPIALATWFVGLRAGLLLSGLSAVVRLQDLWLTTHHFSHPLIPYWNGVVELGFFVVVAYILSIQQADKLVYAAKQDGKDCVRHRHVHRSGASDVEPTPIPEIVNHRPFLLSHSSTASHARGR